MGFSDALQCECPSSPQTKDPGTEDRRHGRPTPALGMDQRSHFVKPLPTYLKLYSFGTTVFPPRASSLLAEQSHVRGAAVSFLRTYRYLIQHESVDLTTDKRVEKGRLERWKAGSKKLAVLSVAGYILRMGIPLLRMSQYVVFGHCKRLLSVRGLRAESRKEGRSE